MPTKKTKKILVVEYEKRARDLGANKFFVKSNTPIMRIVDYAKEILRG